MNIKCECGETRVVFNWGVYVCRGCFKEIKVANPKDMTAEFMEAYHNDKEIENENR